MDYIVSGPVEVAGVAPGGTVSQATLDGLAANVPALIEGGHLKPAPAPAGDKPKAVK